MNLYYIIKVKVIKIAPELEGIFAIIANLSLEIDRLEILLVSKT